jgi:hypothetical protein
MKPANREIALQTSLMNFITFPAGIAGKLVDMLLWEMELGMNLFT